METPFDAGSAVTLVAAMWTSTRTIDRQSMSGQWRNHRKGMQAMEVTERIARVQAAIAQAEDLLRATATAASATAQRTILRRRLARLRRLLAALQKIDVVEVPGQPAIDGPDRRLS